MRVSRLYFALFACALALLPLSVFAQQSTIGGSSKNPTFTTVTATGTNAYSASGASPVMRARETDAASGSQSWRWLWNAQQMALQACDDTFSTCGGNIWTFTRSGSNPANVQLGASNSTLAMQVEIISGTAKETGVLFSPAGTFKGSIGAAGAAGDIAGGSAAGDLVIRTQGGALRKSTDSGATSGRIPAVFDCTTSCSGAGLSLGDQLQIRKGSATSRSSTTSASADPDLTATGLPSGTYRVEVHLDFSNTNGNSKWTITAGGNNWIIRGTQECGNTSTASRLTALANATCTDGSTGAHGWVLDGTAVINSSTLSVDWAQVTSSATSTTLGNRSFLILTRIS